MNEKQVRADWCVRELSAERGAYNGVRWWAEWAVKVFGKVAPSGAVAFPARRGAEGATRFQVLLDVAKGVASTFGANGCRMVRGVDMAAYRGVGMQSPVLMAEGVAPEKWVEFAKAVCAAAKEEKAVVYPAGGGALWWLEKKAQQAEERDSEGLVGGGADMNRTDEGDEAAERESRAWEGWFRKSGKVVLARVGVESWGAPEGVFRGTWMTIGKRQGQSGARFALSWARADGATAAELVLAVLGASGEEVAQMVAGVPGVVCQEIGVASEGKGDGRWLEEVFGERPAGEPEGEWRLTDAAYVQPPRPSVFGWCDQYLAIRARGEAGGRDESAGAAVPMASKVRALSLLQWMGPRSWADKAEARRVPERFEKVLRDGHHAWFRVATGEGVPTSRCWMVFNEPGMWAYWREFGVTRVLDVCPEGCRGYWSADGKQWWQVEACAPRGKRVRVAHVKAAYRAACGEMPWEVPFFDGSETNLVRLAKMYDYVMRVLSRGSMDEETVDRRLERAATARGFNRFANRGLLYGGFFQWEKGEMW